MKQDEQGNVVQMNGPLLMGRGIPIAMVPVVPVVNGNEPTLSLPPVPASAVMGNGARDCKYEDKNKIYSSQQPFQNRNVNRKLPTNGAHRMPVRPLYNSKGGQAQMRASPGTQVSSAPLGAHPFRHQMGSYRYNVPAAPPPYASFPAIQTVRVGVSPGAAKNSPVPPLPFLSSPSGIRLIAVECLHHFVSFSSNGLSHACPDGRVVQQAKLLMGELLTNGFYHRVVMQQRPRDPHFRRGYPARKNVAPRGGASPPVLSTSTPPSMGSDASGNHSEQLSKTNLYIRGLTHNTTDKDLYNLCAPYGNIISTKAILDKQTNKCKGYGFVDFESPVSAEAAVKALANQGVQAQMAKQQEQDPTNLYIANLPSYMAEAELEEMLAPYGSVISTRILRDPGMNSRGVGFARMDNREMCEMIISRFNGKLLAGCKEALLVKFADGGNKRKNQFKSQEQRLWPERAEGIQLYDQGALNQNGLASQVLSPLGTGGGYPRPYSSPVSPFPLQPSTWMHPPQQYILQQSLPPMISSSLDPLHYGALMPQLTAHLSQLQLSGTSYVAGTPHAYTSNPPTPIYPQAAHIQVQPMPAMEDPMGASVQNNGAALAAEDPNLYQQHYNQSK
ncbi:hypothetical protein CDAR_89741 [Caerostris darwini]|uniref:Protein alan shepard n=1 Tax=Caerostris darwini TaxID=1538125 RepID=A0AAV4U9I9_9ARAC|nr:hypothetical protein CDAR_89741 [Caerostris darwini]